MPLPTNQNFEIYKGNPDDSYKRSDFIYSKPEVTTLDELMCVNERLVGLLMILCHSFIVLVFVRVLGLARLVSGLMVNVAASNIVRGLAIFIHAEAVKNAALTNSRGKCGFLSLLETSSDALMWSCLACAIVERIITINTPSHDISSNRIVAPILLSAPWIYCVFHMLMGYIFRMAFFTYEIAFSCKHHLMSTLTDYPLTVMPSVMTLVTIGMSLILIMSRVLHPPYFDDKWEANRLRLEYQTTSIWFQLLVPTYLLLLPSAAAAVLTEYIPIEIWTRLLIRHVCYQIQIYSGLILFVVLLSRKDFRRAFKYVFAKTEEIRHWRQPNYILVAKESTKLKKSTSTVEDTRRESNMVTINVLGAREDYKNMITDSDLFSKQALLKSNNISSWFFDRSYKISPE